MLKRYLFILLIISLVVIFAVQNVEKVTIRLWVVNVNASLSLIIIITLAIGALVAAILAYQEIRSRNRKIKELEDTDEKEHEGSGTSDVFSSDLNDQKF